MVRRALPVLLLLGSLDAWSAQLVARVDHRESRLGEPIVLQLDARGKSLSLDAVDLSALAAGFEVFNLNRSSEGADRARLEATLYPLHAGTLAIPPIEVGTTRSRPLTLTVAEDPDLALSSAFTPDTIYERQRTMLVVTLRDKADRQWVPPTRLEAPGLLLRALGETQREEGVGPEHVNVRELRWEVLGLKGDRYAFKPPMLDAYLLGRRLRVPLPTATLEVRALPSYLPVAVPVGPPALTGELPAHEGKVGQPLVWVLRVAAAGFTPDAARQLLHLPQGERDGLRFYPANFFEEEKAEHGPRALRIELPLVPTAAGAAHLPPLTLPYFDPRTQRIEHATLAATRLVVRDPYWERVRQIAAGLGGVVLLGLLAWKGRQLWQCRQARRAALRRVAETTDVLALNRAVRAFASTPPPTTLSAWLRERKQTQQLAPLVRELEAACFGTAAGADFENLKQRWVAALTRLGPRLI